MGNANGERKFRLPLDHYEVDAIAARIQNLLDEGGLSDGTFGRLVKLQPDLRKADRFLSRALLGEPLPHCDYRPMFFDQVGRLAITRDGHQPYTGSDGNAVLSRVELAAGWVLRVREYVEKLEAHHFRHDDSDDI